jgi:hypothetical protein
LKAGKNFIKEQYPHLLWFFSLKTVFNYRWSMTNLCKNSELLRNKTFYRKKRLFWKLKTSRKSLTHFAALNALFKKLFKIICFPKKNLSSPATVNRLKMKMNNLLNLWKSLTKKSPNSELIMKSLKIRKRPNNNNLL